MKEAMNTDTYTPDTNGLYDKYTVTRKDGSPVKGPTFTLRPQDPCARIAMMAYAQAVEKTNPPLAKDLRTLVRKHDEYGQAEGRWFDEVQLDGLYGAVDAAREETRVLLTKDPLPITGPEGDVVAYVKNEYDPGTPDVPYLPNGDPGYPGDPGYNYWRFLTIEEIVALRQPVPQEDSNE